MIQTSNFANSRNLPCGAISISQGRPRFYKGAEYPPLFPPWQLIRNYKEGKIRTDTFIRKYMNQLNKLNPHEVVRDLLKISPTPVLLCWCHKDVFCHRRVVSRWLREAGYTVKEI